MKILNTLLAGSALILAGGAAAQTMDEPTEAPTTAPAEAPPAATVPGENMPADEMAADPAMGDPAAEAAFTDAEVESFAAAAVKIQALQGDDATKQQEAAQIVAESGIDAETFNAIGTTMQTDPELAERVRMAAAALQQPAG